MQRSGQPVAPGEIASAAHLRALLDLARLLRGDGDLASVLDAVARIISDALGFDTVVINLFREEHGDYEVRTVLGNDRARAALLGDVTTVAGWEPMLDPRFLRGGAFFVPAGALAWDPAVRSFTPDIGLNDDIDDTFWHPEDALFAPLDGAAGHHYGIISVDEPRDGLRPGDGHLEVLAAIAAHAAQTIENAGRVRELRSALRRHQAVLDSSLDAVIAIDSDGRVLEFNPAAEEIFGYAAADTLGREMAELIVAPEEREAHRRGADQRLPGRSLEHPRAPDRGDRIACRRQSPAR